MSQPLVAIVTPVYNGEKYFAECIESVLGQTYQNWEYFIVNNCSTDRSLEIAENYAVKDERIRIHTNNNFLDLGQSWNIAVKQVSIESKFCKVVHSDDWMFPNCLEQMVKLAKENPTVGIVSSYILENDKVKGSGLPYPSNVIPGREVCRMSLLGKIPYVFGSPTALLIRSDLIRKREPFYNEAYVQLLDQTACYEILESVDFGFVHQILTYSRVHDESITSSNLKLNRFLFEKILFVKEYAPIYLNQDEYMKLYDRKLKKYYRYLAWNLFKKNEKEFWHYHKNGLSKLGESLISFKLLKAAFNVIYLKLSNALVNPKAVIKNTIDLPQK